MPTFLFFKGGEKVNEVVGANPKAIEAAIKASFSEVTEVVSENPKPLNAAIKGNLRKKEDA